MKFVTSRALFWFSDNLPPLKIKSFVFKVPAKSTVPLCVLSPRLIVPAAVLLSVTDATVKVLFAAASNDIVPVFVMLSEIVESEVPAVIFTVPELLTKSPSNPLTSLTSVTSRVLPVSTEKPVSLLPVRSYPLPAIVSFVPLTEPTLSPAV